MNPGPDAAFPPAGATLHEQVEEQEQEGPGHRKYGTFGGVFTPTLLTSPISPSPNPTANFEEYFRQRSRIVDDFPGFLYLQPLRPQAGEATHAFLTAWGSRVAFRSYIEEPGARDLARPRARRNHGAHRSAPRGIRTAHGFAA